ncbi:ribonuclease Y [Candidatus Wolfebacteria bacterium]|uniref:Ribonuclease Y n=2 Tax=Parcubacteria group TaxID=1794811 RepID=A0A2M7TGX0_9BACT|nr:ribonuclease Y [Candidatus Wolfebacteria bacterium]NCO44522.1 ribonuclease Y [Candidatus Wolfebacteria bacterium]PIZ45387.1 MAG: ribonuclease Y [Candidatus Wolfebacteria bacterium CG_4_10_14_0_2_um_filter_39_18]
MIYQNPLFWVGLVILGVFTGYFIRQTIASKNLNSAEQKIKRQVEESKAKSKEIVLKAQEKATDLLEEVKKAEKEGKIQLGKLEERLLKKEEYLDSQSLELRRREEKSYQDIEKLKTVKTEIDELKQKVVSELEKVSGMSANQAKDFLLKNAQEIHQGELVSTLSKMDKERREEIEKKSLDIMTTAMQRYARSHVSEVTTSIFNLNDEDLKGKIIGREGRNIRALERATGVEFVIDETPESIVISSFDPIRREIAKMALQKLVKDGRIQPAKIEEKVEEAKQELNKKIIELGEGAAYEAGVYDLPREIIQLLGRLNFRLSYGQNVLTHSIETSYLAAMIASELDQNVEVAKKAALLHDIGKAIDHEVQGSHVDIGRKILKKYGISEEIIKAMEAHHEEYPFASPEAYIIAAADALSASRPGARRDTLENYFKRLGDLEKIAMGFEGVKNAYAISAGRELRIFVIPEKIDDFKALQLAREIANKIESELKYPGEIKVNVIREMKAVEYAK